MHLPKRSCRIRASWVHLDSLGQTPSGSLACCELGTGLAVRSRRIQWRLIFTHDPPAAREARSCLRGPSRGRRPRASLHGRIHGVSDGAAPAGGPTSCPSASDGPPSARTRIGGSRSGRSWMLHSSTCTSRPTPMGVGQGGVGDGGGLEPVEEELPDAEGCG